VRSYDYSYERSLSQKASRLGSRPSPSDKRSILAAVTAMWARRNAYFVLDTNDKALTTPIK
jgi:hypothetical protein